MTQGIFLLLDSRALNTGRQGKEVILHPPRTQGYLAKSRNIFDCHSREDSVLPSPETEARDPAERLVVHGTAFSDTKSYLVQDGSSA